MNKFRTGDRVTVCDTRSALCGRSGTVTAVSRDGPDEEQECQVHFAGEASPRGLFARQLEAAQ